MPRWIPSILLGLTLGLLGSNALANVWSDVSGPARGSPKAIGETSAGCIQGAQRLPEDGEGYMAMHLERDRIYGHQRLIDNIKSLGRRAARGLGILHIGDLGMARGGPMPFGHRSHQTGLDVDVWFDLHPSLHLKANEDRSNIKAFSLLSPVSNGLNYDLWSENHAIVLKAAALLPEVDRIFVNARIKQELCRTTPGDKAWLRKIRPWFYHEDHFHLRLACPEDSLSCVRQDPIPLGDGCDALDGWLNKPSEPTPQKKAPPPKPIMPPECRALLNQE